MPTLQKKEALLKWCRWIGTLWSLQEIGSKCHSAGWHKAFEVGRPRETWGAHWSWHKAQQDSFRFVGTAGRCWGQVARWTCHCSSRGTQVAHRVLPERCPGWNADTLETSELCGPIQGVQDCTCEGPRSQAGTGKNSHVKIRDVGSTFFVSFHTVVSGWTWSRGTWRLKTLWSSRSAHSLRLCTRATSECLPVLSVTRLELLLVILTKPCMYCLAQAVGSVVMKSIGVKAWTPSIRALRSVAQPHEHQRVLPDAAIILSYRNSGRNCLMKVLQKGVGETWCRGVQTLPVRLMNLQWSREHTWNRVRASTVYLRTFRRIRIVKYAWRPR